MADTLGTLKTAYDLAKDLVNLHDATVRQGKVAESRGCCLHLHSLIDFKQRTPTERFYSERLDLFTPSSLCRSDYVVEVFVSSAGGLIQY